MSLEKIATASPSADEVLDKDSTGFFWSRNRGFTAKKRREVLAHLYLAMVDTVATLFSTQEAAGSYVRKVWRTCDTLPQLSDLPTVVREDLFLSMYAEAEVVTPDIFFQLWKRLQKGPFEEDSDYSALEIGFTSNAADYYQVSATPPGFLPKFFSYFRIRKDAELLLQVQDDLEKIAHYENVEKRRFLALAILTFGAVYRELEGQVLRIPSFKPNGQGKLIPYAFRHHLLWEGIKTVSAFPLEKEMDHPGVYICQGTEIWPSQPSNLGTLFANLGKQGSATEPYAHSWKIIHKHLRDLAAGGRPLPYVTGHSMGGSLATQVALYSHPLITQALAFNPPVVEERDYEVFHRLSQKAQQKLYVYANIDDFPFWRMGLRVIGQVRIYLSSRRWKYRALRLWEVIFILPALVKIVINLCDSFPAHRTVFALTEQFISVLLTSREVDKENIDREFRPDRLSILHHLYQPARRILLFARKHFRWKKYEEYLKSQLDILELHEQDVLDTFSIEETEELAEIRRQKQKIVEELQKYI